MSGLMVAVMCPSPACLQLHPLLAPEHLAAGAAKLAGLKGAGEEHEAKPETYDRYCDAGVFSNIIITIG